jgi:hypothetical protein
MPMLGRSALVAATVLLLAGPRDGLAQSPLAGIRAVAVILADLTPEAAKISLTETDLRTKVELKLRMAGLRVVVPRPQGPDIPFLHVVVGVQRMRGTCEGAYIFNVALTLYEPVELPRTKTLVPGWLWSGSSFATIGTNKAREGILGDVDSEVDGFLNAWLAANPK